MKSISELQARAEALGAEAEAIVALAQAESREPTVEEQARFDEIVGSNDKAGLIGQIRTQIEAKEKLAADLAVIMAKKEAVSVAPASQPKQITIPARAKAACKVAGFKSEEDAYVSGQFIMANLFGNKKAKSWCKDHGIKATMVTFDNISSGFLVPEAMESAVIELRLNYGVFRQEAQNVTMPTPKWKVPKQTNEITGYWMAEGTNITPSDLTHTMVELDAKKLAAVAQITSELNDDAIISVSEMVARSVAHTFAVEEDEAGFLGDGTSTYGSIMGLASAIAAGSVVTATTRQTFSALTFADFESMVGKRKMYRGTSNPKWYISQAGWAASMLRLMDASGGNSISDLQAGARNMQFLGYPVVWSETLNSALTGTSGQRACYFGDLAQTAILGTRRGISLAVDNSLGFLSDTIYLRATERVDINVHERGDANNAGGFIALNFG